MSETDLRCYVTYGAPAMIFHSIDDEPNSKCITLHIGGDRIIFFGSKLGELVSTARSLREAVVCLERSLAQLVESEDGNE